MMRSLQRPFWRLRFFGMLFLSAACVCSLLLYKNTLLRYGASSFVVRHLIVEGRERTSKKELLRAIRIKEGQNIWSYPLYTIKQSVEACPWIRMAIIERRLPSTLYIHLLEKKPIALWTVGGVHKIIDDESHIIALKDVRPWAHLLHISGPEAPKNVAELQTMLDPVRKTLPPIRKAVFLRSHRWDLFFDNGILVKLPELYPDKALKKLPLLLQTLEGKDVKSIDLRFPNAVIVEKNTP